MAAEVGAFLQAETGVDPKAAEFRELAATYLRMPS
jgi:glycerol-3-phosphate dehydrogenase